jgi:uncharacterized protein YggE
MFARLLLPLLGGALFASTSVAQMPPALPDAPHIAVIGAGSVKANPDYLLLTLNIEVLGEDAAAAKAEVDERSAKLLNALHDLGIAPEHLKLSPLTASIEYDYDKARTVIGYSAQRSIDARLTDFSLFDPLVKQALAAGVSELYRPDLRSNNETQLREQAQARAIRHATEQARSLAEQFGRALGPVYSIATSDARRWLSRGTIFGDPSDTRVALLAFDPGPITIRQQVYAVFLLGDALETGDHGTHQSP